MALQFFDSNPEMINELKLMDHGSKEYKKFLKKILCEIGGLFYLFKSLKETQDGKRIRKQYFANLAIAGVFLLSMFAWIFIAVALTGGKEIGQFTQNDSVIFFGFILIEILTVFVAFVFAVKCQRILLQGLSFLIDSYSFDDSVQNENKIGNFQFTKYKLNKRMMAISIISFIAVLTIGLCSNGTFAKIFSDNAKEFSKAGITISLTRDFNEKDVISQTATYISQDYMVMALKEEFSVLTQNDISSEISLKDYANFVMIYNSLDCAIQDEDGMVYYDYNKQVSGKDITYLATFFRGSDAFWIVTFACESQNYASSQAQFMAWAKTVKVA